MCTIHFNGISPGQREGVRRVLAGRVVDDDLCRVDLVGLGDAQTAELVAAPKAFTGAVDAGNLEQAKELYAPSRVAYERI